MPDNTQEYLNMAGAAGTALAPATGGLSLALPIAATIYGGFQALKANKELKKLAKEDISYKSTPATRNVLGMSAANAKHGYTAAEKTAFLQQVAANTAKSYRLGTARAGNSMSNVIGASNQIANGQAFNQFEAADANQQRQNQNIYNNMVAQEQGRANQNTAMEFQNNQLSQRAYGQAQQQGVNNIFTGLQMASMVAPYLGGKQPATTPAANGAAPGYTYGVPQMNPNPQQYGLPYQGSPYQLPPDNVISPVFRQNYQNLDYGTDVNMNRNPQQYGQPYQYNNMWTPYFK